MRNIILLAIMPCSCALTFSEVTTKLHQHPKMQALAEAQTAQDFQSEIASAWQDPELQVSSAQIKTAPKNFKIGIMQRIPLTNKHKYLRQQASSATLYYQRLAQHRQLQYQLWQTLITLRKLAATKTILQNNRDWTQKALAVSKRLYANGKIDQRALLDIDLRRAELDSDLHALEHKVKAQQAILAYLCGDEVKAITAVPWQLLEQTTDPSADYQEFSMQARIEQTTAAVKATSLARIPDLKLSSSYTQMNGMPMLAVMIAMPIPISKKHNAHLQKYRAQLAQARAALTDYRKLKASKLKQTKASQASIIGQLQILRTDMLRLATDAKHLAFVAYKLARLTYRELLAAELKLQSIQLQRLQLQATLANQQLQYKYVNGERLYD
ncbi:MAG: TolC family protein [Pseudomonadota bacterium]|nr:TolC family protein [Pseudomonadota bacterium]